MLSLIDGSSYLYRAFYALPAMHSAQGLPTNAIKGVANMLSTHRQRYPDHSIATIFDAPGKTFRHDIYTDYKANRPPIPDELAPQIKPLHELIRAMGLPVLCIPKVEADDVIGTLARCAECEGISVLVCSGDKDLAQLVSPKISLFDPMKERLLDESGVEKHYGVPPKHITDYLGLVGDASDNIPGVSGIGKKTALALIQQLGGLDEIYADLDRAAALPLRSAKKVAQKLAEQRECAFWSKQLATLKTDVPDCTLETIKPLEEDAPQLLALYEELGFKTWSQQLRQRLKLGDANPDAEKQGRDKSEHETVLNSERWLEWLERLRGAGRFIFEAQTDARDIRAARIVGFSVAIESGAAYVPVGHDHDQAPEQLGENESLGQLKPLLEDTRIEVLGHDLKFQQNALANHGITLTGAKQDAMLMSCLLNSGDGRHDLATLAARHLQRQAPTLEEAADKKNKPPPFSQISLEQAAFYAAERTTLTRELCRELAQKLDEQPKLQKLFSEVELPLASTLSRMERTGILIDAKQLENQSQELEERLAALEERIYARVGREFNLNSPQQLQKALFEDLGLPRQSKTAGGQPSTAEPVLQELAIIHEVPQLVLEYRGMNKLLTTYTKRLPEQINPRSGRVHTSFQQALTATGRLSSANPNLQNIPARTPEGRRIRNAFIAPENYSLISADYSQIELRIMAHLSGDKRLIKAFAEGLDIHKATASEVFGKPLDEVSNELRQRAKAINFGLIYGMSAFGLARRLRIPRGDAQDYIDRYFARYPEVRRMMEQTRDQARKNGWIETVCGRRLALPEINSRNARARRAAERAAINAPMQGSAADIIKIAMIRVDAWLEQHAPEAALLLQVHDELIIESPLGQAEEITAAVTKIMADVIELDVALIVNTGAGRNWGEAH